ncbi:MAG: hypothetical protein RLZ12_1058, partial [Bacillota bacterium]
LLFFSFIGFEDMSAAAEEAKNPARDLPRAMLSAIAITLFLYIGTALVMTGIVPSQEFYGQYNPLALVTERISPIYAEFLDLGVMLGVTTGIFVLLYVQTRLLYTMARDRLLPAWFTKLHVRHASPINATWVAGGAAALLAGFVPLETLAEFSSIGVLAAYSFVAFGVIILRKTNPTLKPKFRCPAVPWLPICSVVINLYLMWQVDVSNWIFFLLWVITGTVIYFKYIYYRSTLVSNKKGGALGE